MVGVAEAAFGSGERDPEARSRSWVWAGSAGEGGQRRHQRHRRGHDGQVRHPRRPHRLAQPGAVRLSTSSHCCLSTAVTWPARVGGPEAPVRPPASTAPIPATWTSPRPCPWRMPCPRSSSSCRCCSSTPTSSTHPPRRLTFPPRLRRAPRFRAVRRGFAPRVEACAASVVSCRAPRFAPRVVVSCRASRFHPRVGGVQRLGGCGQPLRPRILPS